MDYLNAEYPHSQLLACGESVGLPDGQMGNSEVGHLNIGGGRVVYQDLVILYVQKSITNPTFLVCLKYKTCIKLEKLCKNLI